MTFKLLWLAGLACCTSTLAAPAPAPASPSDTQPLGCLIEPGRTAEVGAPVPGVISQVRVERGDAVRQGEVLAVLRADVEQAALSVADVRSGLDADAQAAEAGLELARQRLARAEQLRSTGFISEQALDQARAENEVALRKLGQAREQQRLWREERGVARAQVELRTIRAPFAGVIIERSVHPGERVEDKPLFRLARLDPLNVELVVPAAMYNTLQRDAELAVTPELPQTEARMARVKRIDRVIDPASNSFRVRLELPNPDSRMPSGLRCRVDLPAEAQAALAREEALRAEQRAEKRRALRQRPADASPARPAGSAAAHPAEGVGSRPLATGPASAPVAGPAAVAGSASAMATGWLPAAHAAAPGPSASARGSEPTPVSPVAGGAQRLRLSDSLSLPAARR